MVYLIVLTAIILIGLLIATITDLKTREVPDWLSYGLIAIGLGVNLIFSFAYGNYWFFVNSLSGFALFLAVALIMFYTGQWGGGDSKVLMGLGALIGFDIQFSNFTLPEILSNALSTPLVVFLINMLVVGAVYGLMWSLFLVFKNWKGFYREFRKKLHSVKVVRLKGAVIIFVILMLALSFFTKETAIRSLLFALVLLTLLTFYLWVFVKAVEKKCMIKSVTPDKLTEGDWIAKDVKYKGKYICGPKDLGIEKKQIKQLVKLYRQKKIKNILIKEGIPFVPSFLIAYIVTLFWGNLLFLLV